MERSCLNGVLLVVCHMFLAIVLPMALGSAPTQFPWRLHNSDFSDFSTSILHMHASLHADRGTWLSSSRRNVLQSKRINVICIFLLYEYLHYERWQKAQWLGIIKRRLIAMELLAYFLVQLIISGYYLMK